MSAADVLAVATPSWNMKGLRSAKDCCVGCGGGGGFAAVSVAVFEAVSFVLLVAVRRNWLLDDRTAWLKEEDGILKQLLDNNVRRESMDVANMMLSYLSGSTRSGWERAGSTK